VYMCWALREPDTETPFWLEMEDEKENEKECADGIFFGSLAVVQVVLSFFLVVWMEEMVCLY